MDSITEILDTEYESEASGSIEKSKEDTSVPSEVSEEHKKKGRIHYYHVSEESSHTKFYKKPKADADFEVVTRAEYLSLSTSISGSTDTYQCVHGPEGRKYSTKTQRKRNFLKILDPIPIDPTWYEGCPVAVDWGMAEMLEFLVTSPTVEQQLDRLTLHLRDFAKITNQGYRVDILHSFCIIVDYLLEAYNRLPILHEGLILLLKNLRTPIMLKAASDVVTYFDMIRHYLGFLGYLLIRLDDDHLFDLVADALLWHLSAPDSVRGSGAVQLRHAIAAAAPVLQQSTVRMLAVASSHRFPVFLEIALLLACDTADNCIAMMKENIIENLFYRFDPYFPQGHLESYDINPHDCNDLNLKLGDSAKNMTTTISILLILLKTTKQYLEENPKERKSLPYPDCYAQRCFIWAYRYECRAEHRHVRTTLTVIAHVLLQCFRDRLLLFSSILTADIMSLSVLTELPLRSDWIGTVNFNIGQQDVQFKKTLIFFVVDLLKVFPYNKFMLESRYWLLGILYLVDPGLCYLRKRWSPSLFAELRKVALQALVCVLPLADHKLVKQYGLIRRIMWFIEWYSVSPYEISILYWCIRVLQVAIYHRTDAERKTAMIDLFNTHGIIILMHLCYTLMEKKLPPVEKSQAVIALSLRLLTSAVNENRRLNCCVYSSIKWPTSINALAKKMLDVVLFSLEKHFIISDRWLISLLNFIWEAIIWNKEYREKFVANDGIYKLLDIVTMTRPSVQCIALAITCDVARAGDAIGQLVSWRANLGASNAFPNVVTRGATIASLLAAVFRDGCKASGVRLNENGIFQDLDCPIMSVDQQNEISNTDLRHTKSHRNPVCFAAASLAGSRMSKAFALLDLLSKDLEAGVSLADEAYNMYKNVQLSVDDEAVLVLCSHYLTLKLNEVWKETSLLSVGMVDKDNIIIEDFVQIGKGWAKGIKRQQEDVIAKDRKKESEDENSLYAFLGRIRLNIALDALKSVRCVSRSTDRNRITHDLLHDAVFAHHRRATFEKKNNAAPILRTYKPPLDEQNTIGQNVKVNSINPNIKRYSSLLDRSETSNEA